MIDFYKIMNATPLESLTLGDRAYRVGSLTAEQRDVCQKLGSQLGRKELVGDAFLEAIARIMEALISEYHPEVTANDLKPFILIEHFQLCGTELARQLLLAQPSVHGNA